MRIHHLYEAKENSVGIIFGRFNPPHKGHVAAWKMASQNEHWYVGTNKSTQGPKDPLPFDVKIQAMKAIMPEVASHIVAESTWLSLASSVFNKHNDATLVIYTDEDWVTKTISRYNGEEGRHGFYNFKNIVQRPTPRLSSATELRQAVIDGNRKDFYNAAGVSEDVRINGRLYFDLVSEYLLQYQVDK